MTDEERQKLCADLRRVLSFKTLCADAADEIERLAAENRKLRDDVEWAQHVDGVRRRKHYT
jgi:hypothetical protein